MKDLIIKALDEAIKKLESSTPKTKTKEKTISVIDVEPLKIPSFMKENGIPDDAWFNTKTNEEDGYDDVVLSWDIGIPTTENDRDKYRRRRFSSIAFKFVFDALTGNGYERVGFNSGLLKEFDDTTVYDMYMCKSFDRLVKYYSLFFKKSGRKG